MNSSIQAGTKHARPCLALRDSTADAIFQMDNDRDLELAYRLQLEYIHDLEESQMGNQATEASTDANIALQLMRDDLLEARARMAVHNAFAANDANQNLPAAWTGLEARNPFAANDAVQNLPAARTGLRAGNAFAANNAFRNLPVAQTGLGARNAVAINEARQNLLAPMTREERIAEEDRRTALEIENLAIANEFNVAVPEDEGEAVIRGLRELLEDDSGLLDEDLPDENLPDENGPDNGEGPSGSAEPNQAAQFSCTGCLEMKDEVVLQGECGHPYCRECTRQLFLGSIMDEQRFPPRCCGVDAPLGIAAEVLDAEELMRFRLRAIEWVSVERVYCADPACSTFIPADARSDGHGTCYLCGKQTHIACHSLAHPGAECPVDNEMNRFMEVASTQGWRQCSHCLAMVERNQGCHHIVCR